MAQNDANTYFKKNPLQREIYRQVLRAKLNETYMKAVLEDDMNVGIREYLNWCENRAVDAEDYEMAQAIKDIIDESIGLD